MLTVKMAILIILAAVAWITETIFRKKVDAINNKAVNERTDEENNNIPKYQIVRLICIIVMFVLAAFVFFAW